MGKLKTCVVFAVSIFDESRMFILHEFLSMFKQTFSECNLYIGINYGTLTNVEQVIESYELNAEIQRVTDINMYTGSDASAYQAAISLLNRSKQPYDLYWFAHTKGAVNNRSYERNMYLTQLFGNRTHIELMFKNNDQLGSYALRGVSRSAGQLQWATFNKDHDVDICLNSITNKLPFTHVNWSYIETMYVINKHSVETFLSLTTDLFYDTKIQEPCYFETVFPWIATRCGYFPYIHQSHCFFGERNLNDITNEWIQNNNLTHLNNYLTL
jgi:hypothetical protein